MLKKMEKTKVMLIAILLLGALLRFYGFNWDQGFHLHPDERAIVMTVEKLEYPQSIEAFFSPSSPWNPNFFAYGSLPFYLLKVVGDSMSGINPEFAQYSLLNIPGRILSGFFDLLTLIFVFKIGRKLFSPKVGLLAAFFYSVSVLPIQLSHFYAVDTILTCFITITLYQLILFYEKPTTKRAILIGLFFGLALATKISAIVLIAAIGMTLAVDFLLQFLKKPHRAKHWLPDLSAFAQHVLQYASLILLVTLITFVFFVPYAVIDFANFWSQTHQQSLMTKDPFTFPYTLQYVGKLPYLYELKNIFFYGLGPFLGLVTLLGTILYVATLLREPNNKPGKHLILLTFFLIYFAIVGNFTIGFMRYLLPLYPLFALSAAFGVWLLFKYFAIRGMALKILTAYIAVAALTWPASFVHIYTEPNPRVEATNWILENIPARSTLAVEHWDDRLPLFGQEHYQTLTLALYDTDTPEKWRILEEQLEQTDYIILASNRLYTPLQKLTDCPKLPQGRCYEQTAQYYQQLFNGELGFVKVAEFTNYPTVPLLDTPINDQAADESFTVYDHPKVMIFQKQ